MKPYINFTVLTIIILLISCEKELDYNDLNYTPQIVLNGLIYQDSIVKINVSKTKSIMEADSILSFLDNAQVNLYENDVFIENLIYDSLGYYHSVHTTKAMKNYRIEAKTNDIKKATASFNFEQSIGFHLENIEYSIRDTILNIDEPVKTDTNLFYVSLNFDMNLMDNGNEENYYDYDCFGEFISYTTAYEFNDEDELIETVELMPENKSYTRFSNHNDSRLYYSDSRGSYNGYKFNAYISDKIFNGETVNFGLTTQFYTNNPNKVDIVLFSYPYEYVNFHKTGYQYTSNSLNPFSQPINIHSNVENGLGIVCGVTCYKETIDLQ